MQGETEGARIWRNEDQAWHCERAERHCITMRARQQTRLLKVEEIVPEMFASRPRFHSVETMGDSPFLQFLKLESSSRSAAAKTYMFTYHPGPEAQTRMHKPHLGEIHGVFRLNNHCKFGLSITSWEAFTSVPPESRGIADIISVLASGLWARPSEHTLAHTINYTEPRK